MALWVVAMGNGNKRLEEKYIVPLVVNSRIRIVYPTFAQAT